MIFGGICNPIDSPPFALPIFETHGCPANPHPIMSILAPWEHEAAELQPRVLQPMSPQHCLAIRAGVGWGASLFSTAVLVGPAALVPKSGEREREAEEGGEDCEWSARDRHTPLLGPAWS